MSRKFVKTFSFFLLLTVTTHSSAEEFDPPVINDEMRQALRQAMYGSNGFEDHIAAEVWLTEMRVLPSIDPHFEIERRIAFIKRKLQEAGCKSLVLGISGSMTQ